MLRVVEHLILAFIIPGGTKKWILLRELRQEFINFFLIYYTERSRVNVANDAQKGGYQNVC